MSNAVSLTSASSPGYLKALVLTARPKTLAAAVVPVLVATALVKALGQPVSSWISWTAVFSAIFIQIGTNFVNDAIDFVKGADGDLRLGEARATHQGWFSPRLVMICAMVCFLAAFLLGVPLVMVGGWPIVAIGVLSLLLGYGYTGGPLPLAYLGLGDLFVVIFFGLVAVGGVFFIHVGEYMWPAAVAGLQVGFLATVLIAINNLRDLDQDRLVNKKTLAVRLGPRLGRYEVAALFLGTFLLNFYWLHSGFTMAFALPWVAAPFAFKVVKTLLTTPAGRSYNRLLAQAAFVHMLFGVMLSLGLVIA